MAGLTLELAAPRARRGEAGKWWELRELRAVVPTGAKPGRVLAYAAGPESGQPRYAFAVVDETPSFAGQARAVQRSVAILDNGTILAFDFVAAAEEDTRWRMTEGEGVRLSAPGGAEGGFLTAFSGAGGVTAASGVDLAGARAGEWLVLFHTDSQPAGSSVAFYLAGTERARVVVTGLAPGAWEVWRNGWVVEAAGLVRAPEFVLYFEGEAGDYFLRRLN